MTIKSKTAVNSFDKVTTDYFVQVTHQRYKEYLDPEAFEYITGFFSDEVGFLDGHGVSASKGGIPWSEKIPSRYLQKYKEDITAQIPALFGDDEKDTTIKARYWELVTELIIEGYYAPIEKWCKENNKLFVAHLKGEESPYFQVSYSGSCFKVFDNYQVATKGPFILEGRRELATNALIETGLPFYNQSLKISKKISSEASITEVMLNLSNIYTDACKVWLEGKDLGWHWGTEISIYLGNLEKDKDYLLEVELIPNTFNTYGPHKHIEGDRHLTSPDQFRGIKNFADRDNVPEYTLTEEYKFVRFGIGESVKVYQEAE